MFALLATYADRDSGDCWPKQATLAEALGWSEPTVRRALDDLRKLGWLETRPVLVGGRKTQNAYRVCVSPPTLDGTRSRDESAEPETRSEARSQSPTDRAPERDPQSRSRARSLERTDQRTDQGAGQESDARQSALNEDLMSNEAVKRRAHAIATRYYDEFKRSTSVAPPESFVAIRALVKRAVREGFVGPELLAALRELDRRDRPITAQTLWSALLDARQTNPREPSTREAEAAANERQNVGVAAEEKNLDREWDARVAVEAERDASA